MTNVQPDWSKAPEWARFWAMDSDGGAYWYEVEPRYDTEYACWSINTEYTGRLGYIGPTESTGRQSPAPDPDWSQTLRSRP